jgi:glycosyltransferase involved in cell wall biosynthesis
VTARQTNPFPHSVAIVHDYLNQRGGAERVALELARTWPGAPVYTSLYRSSSTFADFEEHEIRTSPLDRLPVDGGFRALAPLYPLAFRSLGVLEDEVVISSSSGWAHGVRTAPRSLHVVYCHTPARWLYRADDHLGRSLGPLLLSPLMPPLRRWDRAAALQADVYVANSEYVRRRIKAVYEREAEVIHPPVDVERFTPTERGGRLLVISRLLPYKRVDLIVSAASRAGIALDVVGVGPQFRALRSLAGSTVSFHGRVDDRALKELLENCGALVMAATEDFGIAPIEANAAGKPVVAYASGGVLETQLEGISAALFHELSEEAVLDAIARADRLETTPKRLAEHARRFSSEAFQERIRALIREALTRREP